MKTNLTILLLLISFLSKAQNLVFNSAQVYNNNALIVANGDWKNIGTGTTLENQGEIILIEDNNPADFYLLDSAIVSGNGIYRLENDWINSSTFICDSSEVYLNGVNQLITGDSLTKYFNLITEGTGTKTQTINTEVSNQLNLTNVELHTDIFTCLISNSWLGAIIHQDNYLNEGFVSSKDGGLLVRNIDSIGSYFFPVGSAQNGHQYRPVFMDDSQVNGDIIGVRMIPNDATNDGRDRNLKDQEICIVNPEYYHQISPINITNDKDFRIYYDPAVDINFNLMAHWNDPIATNWNNMQSSTGSTLNNYESLANFAFNDFSDEYFAFAYYNDETPPIYGDTLICDTALTIMYTTDGYDAYSWTSTHSGVDFQTGTTNPYLTDWENGTNTLSLQVTDAYGCLSNIVNQNIYVDHLNAIFDTTAGLGAGNYDFINSSTGASDYEWLIDDSFLSSEVDYNHDFEQVGTYEVMLVASNDFGCIDTATMNLSIAPNFWIPNIFTPNGDGLNDDFFIDAVGVNEYELEIYDRWGLRLFKRNTTPWNGLVDANSRPAPEGTYYYIYSAEDINGNAHTFTGPFTLVR